MKTLNLGAIAAAGLLAGSFATGANAADLGGNCCADLEEAGSRTRGNNCS